MKLPNPTTAQFWELWRISRLGFLYSLFLMLIASPFLMACATRGLGSSPITENDLILFSTIAFSGILFFSMPISLVGVMSSLKRSDTSLALVFLRPISTGRFALVGLTFACAQSVILYVLAICWLHSLYSMAFPVFPGVIIVATCAAALIAITWGFRVPIAGLLTLFVIVFVFLIVFIVNDPSLSNHTSNPISYIAIIELSWQHALFGLLPIPPFALFLIYALNRQRRSEPLKPLRGLIRASFKVAGILTPQRTCPGYPFTSTRNAQMLYDWRKSVSPALKVWCGLLVMLFILLSWIVANVTFVPSDQRDRQENYFPAFVFLYAIFCSTGFATFISFRISGIRLTPVSDLRRKLFDVSFPAYESTFPANMLSLFKVRLGLLLAAISLMSLSAMMTALLWSLVWRDFSSWRDTLSVLFENPQITLILGMTALLLWVESAAFLLALPYTANRNTVIAFVGLFGIAFYIYVLDGSGYKEAAWLIAPTMMAIGTMFILYSLYLFARAWIWRVLWFRGLAALIAAWAIVFSAAWFLLLSGDNPPYFKLVFYAGLWSISLSGLAHAPLSATLSKHQ